jgi:adenylate kinase
MQEARKRAAAARSSRRADDNRETVMARLAAYYRETAPILPHYRAQGRLYVVGIDEVTRQIEAVLAGLA